MYIKTRAPIPERDIGDLVKYRHLEGMQDIHEKRHLQNMNGIGKGLNDRK